MPFASLTSNPVAPRDNRVRGSIAGELGDVTRTTFKLLHYCQENNWAGYDPYDCLNSKLLQAAPLLNSRVPRLLLTQMLRRSPINIRPLLLIPKTQNPKALALFLSALLRLARCGFGDQQSPIQLIFGRLIALRSPGMAYWCWGYSFPWQTRDTGIVPRGTPNLVCTTFAATALLDLYEQNGDTRCLEMAGSAADYILNELYWENDDYEAGFSYPLPLQRSQTHNSNFLAAALFCRVYRHTGERRFLDPALRVARFSVAKQRRDGAWYYGERPTQRWIDNFHSGYNLCALRSLGCDLGTAEFESSVRRGFEFYRSQFFRKDAAPRYFHNRTYPIDIHCVAQSIITLLALKDLDSGSSALAHSVLRFATKHMWDKGGFFYYRVLRFCTIRTSYMRWSQAWMMLALATYLCESGGNLAPPHADERVASNK
jgi:hypothetical protein